MERRRRTSKGEEVCYNTVFRRPDKMWLVAFKARGREGEEKRLVSTEALPAWQCFLKEGEKDWRAGDPGTPLYAVFEENGHLDKERTMKQFRRDFRRFSFGLDLTGGGRAERSHGMRGI